MSEFNITEGGDLYYNNENIEYIAREPEMVKPTPGRIVWYTSRTGNYYLPAMVMVTKDNLYRPGVEAGHIPDLSGDLCAHLWVYSPGPAGLRAEATDFKTESPHGRQENQGGGYTEFDIAYQAEGAPGTWRWPERL